MKPWYSFLMARALVTLVALLAGAALARASDNANQGPCASGIHEITIRAGFLADHAGDFEVSSSRVRAGAMGALGTIQYQYWPNDAWAVGLAAGAFGVDANFSLERGAMSSSAATIALVHLMVTHRPAALRFSPVARPFFSLGVGPYIGSFSSQSVSRRMSWVYRTRSTIGLRALVGLDLGIARRLKVDFAGGYHLMGAHDLGPDIEGNYSGPEFSVGLGIRLGGG